MKKLFVLFIVYTVLFTGCRDGSENNSDTNKPGNVSLKIRNEALIEITDVIWNNITFVDNQNTIKTGTSATKNVTTGSGYIYFKRKGNSIAARTQELVTVEGSGQTEFVFINNTIIVEVINTNNLATLQTFYSKPWISIKQGISVVEQYGDFDFGSILINGENDAQFTIENIGAENLNFTNTGNRIYLDDNTAGYFTITQQPLAASLAPGNTTTFTIRFKPLLTGSNFSASVHIKTNSQNAEEFAFMVNGTGRSYTIGDTGPGGGIIFYAEGGQFKECSAELGAYNWADGKMVAEEYNGGGFTNWHLPDRGELDLMYHNLRVKGLGGFSDGDYWTSTENSTTRAYYQSFFTGGQGDTGKSAVCQVRAVRGPFSL